MQSASMTVKKIHVLRVDPGEDLLRTIEEFLKGANIQQAVVVGGYGTLTTYHLHWVTHTRIPADTYLERGEGGIELLSMNGLVVGGEPHIHMTLSTPAGAFGGHLEPGCTAYVLCEVYFAEVEGVDMRRQRTAVSVPGMGEGDVSRLVFGA